MKLLTGRSFRYRLELTVSPAALHRYFSERPHQVARYQGRLSGPFLDRLDLVIEVPVIPPHDLQGLAPGEASTVVAARVAAARERALRRQGVANALLPAQDLATHAVLEAPAKALLERSAEKLGWSAAPLRAPR